MLEAVERWFKRLPPDERDMPILRYKGRSWTPRQILREVRAGTSIGKELQEHLERLVLGLHEGEIPLELAEERLLMWLEEFKRKYGPKAPVFITLTEGPISAEELIRQIRERRGLGGELLETEREYIMEMLRLYGGE